MHKNSFKNIKHKVKILTNFTHKSGPHWLLSLVVIYLNFAWYLKINKPVLPTFKLPIHLTLCIYYFYRLFNRLYL